MKELKLTLLAALISYAAFAEQAVQAPPKIDRGFKVEVKADGIEKKVTFKARDLYKHAEFLASEECGGRFPGTLGHERAREYIIGELKDIGFKEVRRFAFDFVASVELGDQNILRAYFTKDAVTGKKDWYRNPLPTKQPESNGYSEARFLPQFNSIYALNDDFRPLRISEAGTFDDKALVFAGYGISAPDRGYDDYKDLDVKGKIVLVLAREPETPEKKTIADLAPANPHAPPPAEEKQKLDPAVNPVAKPDQPAPAPANPHKPPSVYGNFFYKASTARDKGAAGVIVVHGPRGTSEAERASLEAFERGFGGRTGCGLPIIQVFAEVADDLLKPSGKTLAQAQKAIDEKLAPASFPIEGVRVFLQTDIKRPRATDENLAVVIPGCDPALKDEIVVIGAHYDHLGLGNEFSLADKADMGKVHGGADDNASGSSSVIELARALYKNRKDLKRTVWLMWFGAEELGTLGSIDFLKRPPQEFKTANVAAMLNLDMVGRA
ncbi:MAG TPA: M20/M25/M40 family metallo-hydrolase, partial [Planctomycetota bacterium]|nr:M20/M25/M40 family metallo-hydrolase [Planctomycetota bacterium]